MLVAKLAPPPTGIRCLWMDRTRSDGRRIVDSSGALTVLSRFPVAREVIHRRLDRPFAGDELDSRQAAAIGNEFEFHLCQSVADVSPDEAIAFR